MKKFLLACSLGLLLASAFFVTANTTKVGQDLPPDPHGIVAYSDL